MAEFGMKKIGFIMILAVALALEAGCNTEIEEGTQFVVINCMPADHVTNVPVQSAITLRFTHQVDHRSIIGTKQIILVSQQNAVVPVSFQFNGELVTITPGSPLAVNATYGVAVRPGVRDIFGDNIEIPFEAVFSTGSNVGSIPNWPPYTIPVTPGVGILGPPGTFTPVGSLFIPRARHTATRLLDGRVIVIGGERTANFGTVERTAEIYNPTTLQWTLSQCNNGAGMYYERAGHTATLLLNGRILITGGTTNGLQAMANAEVYDPLHDAFSIVLSPMNSPRMFHTDTLLPNGNVLLVSGATTSVQQAQVGTVLTDTLEVFDVNSGTFHLCGATLTPFFIPGSGGVVYHKTVLLPDNTVLVTGGMAFVNAPLVTPSSDLYVPDLKGIGFNGTINFFSSRGMQRGRCEHTTTLVPAGDAAGLLIVTGGMTTTTSHQSAEVYDYLAVNPSSQIPGIFKYIASNLTVSRRSHTATFIPRSSYAGRPNPWGKILVVGGAAHIGTASQGRPYPPHFWPFIEPAGCTCSTTVTADLFDPFMFVKNIYLAFRGVDQTGQFRRTQDQQGNTTVVPNYVLGLYWHTATGLQDGSVLIVGGMDCPFACMTGMVEGVPMASACVYNP